MCSVHSVYSVVFVCVRVCVCVTLTTKRHDDTTQPTCGDDGVSVSGRTLLKIGTVPPERQQQLYDDSLKTGI